MHLILFLSLILACNKKEAESQPSTPVEVSRYEEVAGRLMGMLDDGWVVSRYDDGHAEAQGDSLIWTGIAMGSLDCERGKVPEAALLNMLKTHGGVAYRHPSLPDQLSLDGLLGLWWGIKERTKGCPESSDSWRAVLQEHAAHTSTALSFKLVLAQVMADLGLGGEPSDEERGRLGSEVVAWSLAVVAERAAAFRLHLGYLILDTVSAPKAKVLYCGNVKEAEIPLLEHFCGRAGLREWVESFQYDRFTYRHQMAPWQSEHMAPDEHSPAVDFLIATKKL